MDCAKKLTCIIIGAGFSGILIAIKLREHVGNNVDFYVFEKNHDVGGTWLENRYPGAACDVPSHIYQYSFCPNPYWSKVHASSGEIQSYLKAVVSHYALGKHIQFRAEVTKAVWNDAKSKWQVTVNGQNDLECDVLINASGILNNMQWPQLKNMHTFTGTKCHTAAWDDKIDLKNKRVAIVGAGATAIQLLPAIQEEVSHIDIYIRTPSWITSPTTTRANPVANHVYTDDEKQRFVDDVKYSIETRKEMEAVYNGMFKIFRKGSTAQVEIRTKLENSMRALITKPELVDKLVPTFDVGCRRINPGVTYLNALQCEKVDPIFDDIEEVYSTGIKAGGTFRDVDIIIAATGFNTSFVPRFPIIGTEGHNLQELWAHEPEAYMGLAVAGFPNYLTFLGPNTPIANGSLLGHLEATAEFFIRLLDKKVRERVTKFSVCPKAQADFNHHTQRFMQDMVWTGPCNSWYKSKSGRINAVWPGSSLQYIQILKSDRWEDWQWSYQHSRFGWWEDGISETEQQVNADLAYYIEHHPALPIEAFCDSKTVVMARHESAGNPTERLHI